MTVETYADFLSICLAGPSSVLTDLVVAEIALVSKFLLFKAKTVTVERGLEHFLTILEGVGQLVLNCNGVLGIQWAFLLEHPVFVMKNDVVCPRNVNYGNVVLEM
ncbi:hypothetical protein K7X08_001661 [Anisodus acutangulus]|uniref:Uncharacterized protein n=1 Tax=Anisodus acutangulus TaxID=402998 RepID=A0A9Q1R570_9SOLA|nr:hypothetical protein K7X08_001661 [Anisodus acutangulus]